ncbi:hypothetical protein ABL78_5954 [Leptomonas seymouri]|uniref:Uncharacterized protein n=1 Tax=Leptomonas seymouri TaxID=5684 RepID=A0A0N1I2S3_LEPSE|nr:hypothetical protein ABL78_5954 [Leptomonas seymouri]|eukprot:KPI84988.1 hypothetical protein ABL78_5954 [Leptomonas seymouri]
MSLRAVVSIPADMEDGAAVEAAVTATPYQPQVTALVSRTSSGIQRPGDAGDPLHIRSENSSFYRCRSTGERSLVAAPCSASPSYRHNPYVASPASEACLYLASPESTGLEEAAGQRSSNGGHHIAHERSVDVTSDGRLVVRSRSHHGMSSLARSTSESGGHPHHRSRHMSPVPMSSMEDPQMAAADAAPRHYGRQDSSASLYCDNFSGSAMLYSCTESSSTASHHASPSPGQISSLVRAPASPLTTALHTRRRTESPLNKSHSRSSPETSSLYYSFGNQSSATAASTSNNPYVGVRFTPEAPAALAVNQDGVSPYSVALQQRHSTVPRINNDGGAGGEVGGFHAAYRRTPIAEDIPFRMTRAYPSMSSRSTTPQNSPGNVVLNSTEFTMDIPSIYVSPTAAAHAAAQANVRTTATPRSRRSDTPPPYNLPSSTPLSPETASMIVPQSQPAVIALHQQHYHTSSGPVTLPPYAVFTDAARPEASTSSQNSNLRRLHSHTSAQLQRQRQTAEHTPPPPPPPYVPPPQAAHPTAANPPPYIHSSSRSSSNGGIQLLYSLGSDLALPSTTTSTATTTPSRDTAMGTTAIPAPPPYDSPSRATTPDQTDVLSDQPSPTHFRNFTAAGEGSGSTEEDEEGRPNRKGGKCSSADALLPITEKTYLASGNSTNGMTRTVACLPEMLSEGPATLLALNETGVATAEAGMESSGAIRCHVTPDVSEQKQRRQREEVKTLESTWERSQGQPQHSTAAAPTAPVKGAMADAASDEDVDDDDDDDGEEGGARMTSSGATTADGKKVRNRKKKRARRSRKLKFLEDIPPVTEMKFLPPPPPPLPAPYDYMSTALDFDKFYALLLRWYERILADEDDFVGLSYAVLPPNLVAAQANANGAGSLEASQSTLHNSGMLQNSGNFTSCNPATIAVPTPEATPTSTLFALTSFANAGPTAATPPTNSANAGTAARARRTPGGGEVPVRCPRIEQYMPLCDIPPALRSGMQDGPAPSARRYSLLSTGSNFDNAPAPASGAADEYSKPADGGRVDEGGDAPDRAAATTTSVLHVQNVDKAVQWAKDLNSWWLCYVHPHSFTSRRQNILQGFPISTITPTATAVFTQPNQGSNMGSMYGWSSSSFVMTGYEGQQTFPGPGGMGSGGVGMSVMGGIGSVTAAASSDHPYPGRSMQAYSPYSIPGMIPPPPPLLQQQQPQTMPHPSMMGIYTIYHHQ